MGAIERRVGIRCLKPVSEADETRVGGRRAGVAFKDGVVVIDRREEGFRPVDSRAQADVMAIHFFLDDFLTEG